MSLTRDEVVEQVVRTMRATFDVERIILFGSQARGDAGPDSDYDFLVVVNSEQEYYARQQSASVAVNPRPAPLDLIVLTARELAKTIEIPGTFAQEAVTEGRIVYAA